MDVVRAAICHLCWKEKVSDMDVMENAVRMGEKRSCSLADEAAV